jgi:hypothetical protein
VSVWADGDWMLGDDDGGLAEEVVRVLAPEPVGLSCDELAARLHRRRRYVLDALRADPRFEHAGRGRGSRWRVTTPMPPGRTGTGAGGAEGGAGDGRPAPPGEDAREAAVIPGQTTVYEMLGEPPAA